MLVRVLFSKSTVSKSADKKNVPFSCKREAYPSHFSPFSKYAGQSSVFKNYRFQNLPTKKNVPFSCKREAYPSHFSPFSKYAGQSSVFKI